MRIDRPIALATAAFAAAAVSMHFDLLPLVNQAWTRATGFDEAQVGLLNGYALGGFTLGVLSSPAWVRRVPWRVAVAIGAIATAALSAALPHVAAPLDAPTLFIALGLSVSLVQASTITMIGDASHPERAYGVMYAVEMALAIVLSLVATASVIPEWGLQGILLLIAATTLLVVPFVPALPNEHPIPDPADEKRSRSSSLLVLFTLSGIAVFTFGVVGTWSFLEHMAEAKSGMKSGSLIVTAALVASLCGSIASSIVDDRWGRTLPLALATVSVVGGILLLDASSSSASFFLGATVTCFAWNFGLTFATSLLARVDVAGRYVALSLGAMGLGAAAGTAFLGGFIKEEGYSTFLMLSALLAGLGLMILIPSAVASTTQN